MSVKGQHAQPSLPIGSSLGPYQLVDLIAVGGMAEVYLAQGRALDGKEKLFALKVIQAELAENPAFVQMLADEAAVSVGLHHPNIVQTFDLGQIGQIHFLSMEYQDGGDFYQLLRDITDAGGEVPMDGALWVAREMLLGLAYAHEKLDDLGRPLGIIHRDISPQNILLSRAGAVKLVDFGIAKAANVSSSTRAGVIKGKLIYMSPEQSWGDPLDQRSDLFSAGVVLYEALIGGSLYLENNPVRLLQKVRQAEIAPPSTKRPEIPAALDRIVMRALAVRAEDRYQNAREFCRAVDGYLMAHYPDYNRQALARLVCSVREGGGVDLLDSDSMERGDFPISKHSIIFTGQPGQHPLIPPSANQEQAPDNTGEDAKSAKLVLFGVDGVETTHPINHQLVIGRGGDLRLSDGRVSRRHARVLAQDDGYILEDLSANGTFINDEKMKETHRLVHGDRIRVGPFKMQFLLDEDTVPRPVGAGMLGADPPPGPPPSPAVGGVPPMVPGPSVTAQGGAPKVVEAPAEAARGTRPLPQPAVDVAQKVPKPAPAAIFARAGLPGPADITAKDNHGPSLRLRLGDEWLEVPMDTKTALGQQVGVGGKRVNGPAGTVLRRNGAYWLEPVPRRDPLTLNGQTLSRPTQLTSGDRIGLGPLELQFQAN